MNITELFNSPVASVAIMGAIGTIIFSLKEIPIKVFELVKKKVVSRFIFTATIPDYDDLFQVVEKWVFEKYNREYRDVHASMVDSSNPPLRGKGA